MLSRHVMAMSSTLILSPERWKIRVFRYSEGSLERITKLERVSMAIILSTGTAKPGAVRELDSPAGREHSRCLPGRSAPRLFPSGPTAAVVSIKSWKQQAKPSNATTDLGTLQVLHTSPDPLNTDVDRRK